MSEKPRDPIFGAAILKLSFSLKKMTDEAGFRVVYFGALKELGLTDREVTRYIEEHRKELEAHILAHNKNR